MRPEAKHRCDLAREAIDGMRAGALGSSAMDGRTKQLVVGVLAESKLYYFVAMWPALPQAYLRDFDRVRDEILARWLASGHYSARPPLA
eukprot:1191756-Lingulodinium_polyedra.AAC.1